jgi:hypothetical protein
VLTDYRELSEYETTIAFQNILRGLAPYLKKLFIKSTRKVSNGGICPSASHLHFSKPTLAGNCQLSRVVHDPSVEPADDGSDRDENPDSQRQLAERPSSRE